MIVLTGMVPFGKLECDTREFSGLSTMATPPCSVVSRTRERTLCRGDSCGIMEISFNGRCRKSAPRGGGCAETKRVLRS